MHRRRHGILGALGAASLVAAGALAGLACAAGAGTPRAAGAPAPLVVRVAGNHLVNGAGRTLRLLGVDRSGAEYMCMQSPYVFDGPADGASIAAIAAWHANAVRLPLNEDCWLGISGANPAASGATYRTAIVHYVEALHAHGLYVILDLHWAAPSGIPATSQWPMADADHAPAFWHSVAATFKDDHGVLFDLFNEPFGLTWPCWRSGCSTTYTWHGRTVRYRAAGMQLLVNVVRSTGATNPIMLGGLAWADDESHWLQYRPHDPVDQLVVSFHSYSFARCDTPACWDATVAPLSTRIPVVTGEFGESGCRDTYDLQYMPWADAHGVSYLGWAWNSTSAPSHWSCSLGPSLIVNYRGRPTPYGAGLRSHLAQLAAKAGG